MYSDRQIESIDRVQILHRPQTQSVSILHSAEQPEKKVCSIRCIVYQIRDVFSKQLRLPKNHCRAAMERLPMNDPLTIVFYQQWVMLQIHSDSDKALLRKRRNFTTIDFIEYRKLRSTLHSRLWRLVSFSFSFRLQFAQEKLWSLSCSFHLNRSTSYWNNSLFKTIP